MQSHIAQVVTLTTYARAFVTRGMAHVPSTFYPGNSSFTYCERVRFVDRARAGESWTETEYAPDPVAWFSRLAAAQASAVRMHYGATGGQALGEGHVSDRMLAAFAGGGGRWLIEVTTPEGADLWEPRWEVGDRDRADQRIWHVTYARISTAASAHVLQADDAAAVTRDLASALTAIATFARAQSLPSFATAFDSGLARLRSADPFEGAANADIVPVGAVSVEALRLLAAARAAWVFGGMGSWNDQGFEGETHAQYERLSDDLYRLLNMAIVTAANTAQRAPAAPLATGAVTMTHATRHASTGLAALAVLSLGHWARANDVFASPVATFILGVLPNVAAAVAIPSITAGALADMRKDRQVPVDLRTFTMLNLGSVAGLVAWEFVQRGSLSLRFDPADLVATVVGAAVAQWAFRWHSSSAEGRASG